MRGIVHFLVGALAMLLVAELGLRLLPVSTATQTGYYLHPDILSYPPGHVFTTAEGWDLRFALRQRANNYGFVASRDFVPDRQAVALIGDSYVEASALPESERPAARLQARLGGRPVYAFGGPGSSLLDYAGRIAFVHRQLGVHDFVVVLERFDVFQAACGSGQIHAYCIDPQTLQFSVMHQPPGGLLKRIVRESALAQYLFSQLKLNPATLLRFDRPGASEPGPAKTAPGLRPAVTEAILQQFVAMLPDDPDLRLVFVIDPKRTALFDDAAQRDEALDAFAARMRQHGAAIADPTPLFRAEVRATGRSLRISPQDGHWNARASELVAAVASEQLEQAGKWRRDGTAP